MMPRVQFVLSFTCARLSPEGDCPSRPPDADERKGHDVAAIWAALAGRVSTARVNLHFELSDEDAEERRLIGTAVAKARLSAEALAAAAGTELAGVKEIRYNRSGDSCFWRVACADASATPNGAASSMPDLHPEPIDVECSVDVDWWLKPSA